MHRILVFCLLALIALGGLAQTNRSADEAALRSLLDTQTAAWNRGDATGWAAAFTPDADFVNIRGDLFEGRVMINQRHAVILAGPFHGSHTTVIARKIIFPAPDVALIETVHEVTGFHALPPGIVPSAEGLLRTRMKYVARRTEGGWLFIAAQNTAELPAAPAIPR